jgi:hypothetical protein
MLGRHCGTLAHAAVVSLPYRRRDPSGPVFQWPSQLLRGGAPLPRLTALQRAKRRDSKARADNARKVIADPTVVARRFTESVGIVESTSRNYQAFHPNGQTFCGSAD